MSNVKLVGITQPRLNGPMCEANAEEFIAYCARVSNPANQYNPDSTKLLKYLVKHKHWSPFEMVSLTMEINTTRDIARQILRHRSFSFQEFSQRYASVTEMSEPREARMQDNKNRQNSIETNDVEIKDHWKYWQEEVLDVAERAYHWGIANGVAKEQARVVLPEGLTMSRMYMSGTLRSWIHYCELRMANGTQKEHRQIATECWNVVIQEFPSLKELFDGA